MEIIDIHTHRLPPQPDAVTAICLKADGSDRAEEIIASNPDRLFSVGVHPWDVAEGTDTASLRSRLEALAALPTVVALGECGVDLNHLETPLFRQIQIMKWHVDLSERAGLPLVIHDVRAHDIIVGIRRDMSPTQPWAIHGFRNKWSVAEMMLRAGMHISFGPLFNAETVARMPHDRILAETDSSDTPLEEVTARLSDAAGHDLRDRLAANAAAFLRLPAAE